jgi:hypothetical protein
MTRSTAASGPVSGPVEGAAMATANLMQQQGPRAEREAKGGGSCRQHSRAAASRGKANAKQTHCKAGSGAVAAQPSPPHPHYPSLPNATTES